MIRWTRDQTVEYTQEHKWPLWGNREGRLLGWPRAAQHVLYAILINYGWCFPHIFVLVPAGIIFPPSSCCEDSLPWVWIPSCLWVWILPGVQSFLGILQNMQLLGFAIAARRLAEQSVIRWWENCIVYSLFCILLLIIIISSSISLSFTVLLNCLYLNPFCPFLLPISLGGKERGEQAAV